MYRIKRKGLVFNERDRRIYRKKKDEKKWKTM